MKNSLALLGCKAHPGDGEVKRTSCDRRKSKVPGPVGLLYLLAGLPWVGKRHPGGEKKVSVLVHDRAADATHGGDLTGNVLARCDCRRWGWSLGQRRQQTR
jgi:hypothetical protein